MTCAMPRRGSSWYQVGITSPWRVRSANGRLARQTPRALGSQAAPPRQSAALRQKLAAASGLSAIAFAHAPSFMPVYAGSDEQIMSVGQSLLALHKAGSW